MWEQGSAVPPDSGEKLGFAERATGFARAGRIPGVFPPPLSQVRSPVSSSQAPTFRPLKFGPRGLLSLAAEAWPGESGCTCFRRIMVALEVGLPSLHRSLVRSLARSLPPPRLSPRAPSFPFQPASPAPSRPARAPPARSHLHSGLSRSPSESGAGRPCGPDSATGCRDGAPSPRGGRGAGGGGAAGRSPGRNQGWAGGGDAGVREPWSRSERTSVAGAPGRRSTAAGAGRAAHKVRCPGGARARGGRRGAARREDARELRGAGRRGGAAPAGGGGPGLRPERAPCPARADGPEPARSGRAGQVGGGPSPGTRVGAGPATRPTP